MEYKCPECNRLLYNRRLMRCGYCGALIPKEMRMTKEQMNALDAEEARFEEQLAAEKKRRENRARRKSTGSHGGGGIGDMMVDFDPGE